MATTAYHYYHCRPARADAAYRREPQNCPERLNSVRLKNKLCAQGPKQCAACGGCGFGREWVRRHPEGSGKK